MDGYIHYNGNGYNGNGYNGNGYNGNGYNGNGYNFPPQLATRCSPTPLPENEYSRMYGADYNYYNNYIFPNYQPTFHPAPASSFHPSSGPADQVPNPKQVVQEGYQVVTKMRTMMDSFSSFLGNLDRTFQINYGSNNFPAAVLNASCVINPSISPETETEVRMEGGSCLESNVCATPETEPDLELEPEPEPEPAPINENVGRPKRGRRRKFKMTREERKVKKDTYEEYENCYGKFVEGKGFREYICLCHRECHRKVSVEERVSHFNRFKNCGSFNTQTAMLKSYVVERPARKISDGSKRKCTRRYKIGEVEVCQAFLCQTLRISTKRVSTALKKFKTENILDQRNSNGGHNRLSESRVTEVKDHIQKIPKYKSHYCRNVTETQFLPHDMTLQRIYQMYCKNYSDPVSFSAFRLIYHTNFNLRRKPLQKDTCSTCDSLECAKKAAVNEEKLKEVTAAHDLHLSLAGKARAMMDEDMKAAKTDFSLETLTFDLQQTLPLPRLPSGILFYKRQLMLYNCGVHSGKTDIGHCYTWLEGVAGRGAQEVGSVLKKHLQGLPSTIKSLKCWSDSCGGQNRNIKIVLLLKACLEENQNLEKITLNFLVPGHTYLVNDKDFGDIECALKYCQRVYTQEDYEEVMRTARRKNPLKVHSMTKDEFFSTEGIEKNVTNRKKDVNKGKINWLETRSIQLHRDKPHSIFMSKNYSGDYVEVDIEKKSRGFKRPAVFYKSKLLPLWPDGKPISVEKLNDIRSYLNLIPPDQLEFYQNLTSSPDVFDDVDGFNGCLDFEIEEFLADDVTPCSDAHDEITAGTDGEIIADAESTANADDEATRSNADVEA